MYIRRVKFSLQSTSFTTLLGKNVGRLLFDRRAHTEPKTAMSHPHVFFCIVQWQMTPLDRPIDQLIDAITKFSLSFVYFYRIHPSLFARSFRILKTPPPRKFWSKPDLLLRHVTNPLFTRKSWPCYDYMTMVIINERRATNFYF